MSILTNLALFMTYALLAGAILLLPNVVDQLALRDVAWVAAVVFLFGFVAHEVMARHARESQLVRRIGTLRRELADVRAEMGKTRADNKKMLDAIGQAPAAAADGTVPQPAPPGRNLDDVVAEVKVLQSLIEQLYAKRSGEPAGRIEPLLQPAGERRGEPEPASMLDVVRDALKRDRIELFLQPVVSLPQRKHRFYECFSRITAADGQIILPEQYLDTARRSGLIAAIDNLLLFKTVQLVRRVQQHKLDVAFVCNVSPHTLGDSRFLADFVSYIGDHTELASKLIFEFTQADFGKGDAVAAEPLAELQRLGFRFSLDQVTELKLDIPALQGAGVRFVKLPASTVLAELRVERPKVDPRALKNALDRAGIDLIVEKVESESDLIELLDFQIDFGQGFLFGEPRIAKE